MWWRFTILIGVLICSARALGDGFPYVAYVNSADVYVRSGPGRDYYPTEKLAKGQEIEVYRHDPGGWLAIRPPRGSYSWVSARHLDLAEDNLAVVNSDRVVARVGSTFSDVRDVIQVRLERDEKVALIETPASDSPWCKIAPPAGEFRWVFAKYVDRELPTDLADDARDASGSNAFTSERGAEDSDRVRLTGGDDQSDADRRASAPADPQLHAELAGDLDRLRELERIDMALSEIVAEDISQWSFTALLQRAETALRSAQGSLERGRARNLLDKLARFDEIKQRHDVLKTAPAGDQPAPAVAAIGIPNSGEYDGVGRLAPVVTQKTGGPQFALLDQAGEVISFVTPAPGVNLRPYVDQYVGVNGQRGYLTDMQRQHVSVKRVTVLDVQRR